MQYMKKIAILFLSLFICIICMSFDDKILVDLKNYDNHSIEDNITIADKIHNTMDDVESYLNDLYSSYDNYSLTTNHNFGLLSTFNINQSILGAQYNNLSNKHDLNGDGLITSADNLRLSEGICQPIAVTMALRYMVLMDKYSYIPKVNIDELDEINILYDVVDAYISNGWQGAGAARNLCYQSINDYFSDCFADFTATYYTTNLMYYIDNSYENRIPAIGHICAGNSGHAVTICGYYTKIVTYTETGILGTVTRNIEYNFVGINTGWVSVDDTVSGVVPDEWYENNYSFIDVNNLDAVTYIS